MSLVDKEEFLSSWKPWENVAIWIRNVRGYSELHRIPSEKHSLFYSESLRQFSRAILNFSSALCSSPCFLYFNGVIFTAVRRWGVKKVDNEMTF